MFNKILIANLIVFLILSFESIYAESTVDIDADKIIFDQKILDVVTQIIGNDVLCWNSLIFHKKANSKSWVSMHQDQHYWGIEENKAITVSMALYSSFKMKIKLSDINAQPKMFHHSFKKHIEEAPDDFSLDLFLLYKASINNYSIMEYPVNFSERIFGSSKGGGTFIGKIKLMIRTLIYINKLKLKLKG